MGKRGPAAKPTSLRVLHGDRADRINHSEPVPPAQEITCPDWASDAARAIWDRLAPGLEQRGVLTAWDLDAFLILCEALARYRSATALVNGSALLVQGGSGLMRNPALQVQAEAERVFLQYAARFGLTPSDRQSIKVEVGGDQNQRGGPGRLLS
ncbi:phage terminase small subunit P27 family [Actinosynnema mirum]|uniref:Phage terminase, small subunit, P27 family n=1 Tax=Actinosynnema mirum (strain ATCC 29888 / DSM 43827 / JCM 3225 / NBRC 14064 / NCIMB 13271 / NRRL B-12336 / IMRU 3971 / 101) TaxID=446462 RepID=C6W8S3_ACTMD|nr:phage terminase small subunit P27 family [Actinosynnema mirum]ACU37172.1 phage terminase, small subunit, P27 family [Actinosynnema mirum DSM 43827]